MSLSRVAAYRLHLYYPFTPSFNLIVSRGSVVDFSYPSNAKSSAIVNSANEGCLGGGGVDGAVSAAGGSNLLADRQALPEAQAGIRCPTGSAIITGPNSYGKLNTRHVIHAVGPDYRLLEKSLSKGDALLSSAYSSSLERAKSARLEAVAFSLLSAGIFRGSRGVKEVLRIGMDAICKFGGYAELQEIHMCAFNKHESDTLLEIAYEMGLENTLKNTSTSNQCDIQ